MTDEYRFSPEEVTLRNLEELAGEESIVDESRMLEIRDIAISAADYVISLLDSDFELYEALSMAAEGIVFGDVVQRTKDAGRGAEVKRNRAVKDRVRFAQYFVSRMKQRSRTLSESDFLGAPLSGEVIGYVRNQFSDEAYDVFSQEFRDPRVRYYGGFKELSRALADGEVDYVLLPLEERGGVRLPSVAEIIYRFDFKINSVTPVFGFDAGADIKYALISRRFKSLRARAGDDRYIEIRVPAGDGYALPGIIDASSHLGMTVYRINTLTLGSDGDSTAHFSLVLREGGKDFTALLTYLALFTPDLVPVGVYKNLE